MLSSKQIEIFYEVYKNNSMTIAAERLGISQPSVSKTLSVMEKNLGFKLFIREGKRLYPSEEANDLYEHASIVNSQFKNFNYIANTFKSRSTDFINIGTTPSLAETIVPKVIKKYLNINPDSRFNLINLNSIDLIEDRYKPDIDMTICFNAPKKNKLKSAVIKTGRHVLVSPKSFEIKESVDLRNMSKFPYIEITNLLSLYTENSIMNYLITNNIKMNFFAKSDSYSAALSMISQGIGISILDDNTAERANPNNVNISDIENSNFEYEINALLKKEVIRSDCDKFFNFLCEPGLLDY